MKPFGTIKIIDGMGYELTHQGEIISSKKVDNGHVVGVDLMPHCSVCRTETYKCDHISGESKCTMYFHVEEEFKEEEIISKSFECYVQREQFPHGKSLHIDIF